MLSSAKVEVAIGFLLPLSLKGEGRLVVLRGGFLDLAHRDRSRANLNQLAATGILPIRALHSRGPVSCTDVPRESTATVTGMSLTSNS
jgi:hypothetical protein